MVQFILMLTGAVCLVIALAFGLAGQTVEVRSYSREGTFSGSAPGPAAQGAACGFAIAGGLCMVAAALVHRTDQTARVRVLEARLCEAEAAGLGLRDDGPVEPSAAAERPRD